jgi:hypothetical protein
MTYPDLSPKAWAVLRDLEDTERHRRCDVFVWRWREGVFTCSMCGVQRRGIEQMVYTAATSNEDVDSRIIGGPASVLIPPESGRCSIRGMRP